MNEEDQATRLDRSIFLLHRSSFVFGLVPRHIGHAGAGIGGASQHKQAIR